MEDDLPKPKILCDRYKLTRKLGLDSDVLVFKAVSINEENKEFAVKLESIKKSYGALEKEKEIYKNLGKASFLPEIEYFGEESGYNFMVMELLGPSLEDLMFKYMRFSLKTTIMLADQILYRLEYIHSHGYIHCGLKPANLVMGREHTRNVHVIDFETAKKFRNGLGVHIPFTRNVGMTGSLRFSSRSGNNGYEMSRRDDLESLGYCMVYFLKGSLPWVGSNMTADSIGTMKMTIPITDLCSGSPFEFDKYFEYVRDRMIFTTNPDYDYLHGLFKSVLTRYHFDHDYVFDWHLTPEQREKQLNEEKKATKGIFERKKTGEKLVKEFGIWNKVIIPSFDELQQKKNLETRKGNTDKNGVNETKLNTKQTILSSEVKIKEEKKEESALVNNDQDGIGGLEKN